MAVKIKKGNKTSVLSDSADGLPHLKYLGVSEKHLYHMEAAGIQCRVTKSTFLFIYKGKTVRTFKVYEEVMGMVADQTLAAKSKEVLRGFLESEINAVLGDFFVKDSVSQLASAVLDKVTDSTTAMEAAEAGQQANLGTDYPNHNVDDGTVKVYTEATPLEVEAAEPIDLAAASSIGQVVHGTNQGSRYYVCALSPQVKLACRFKPDGTSIRAEGFTETQAAKLKEVGFTIKGSYASIHLGHADSPIVRKRTVGAVLFSLDMLFTQVATNLVDLPVE